MEKRHTEAGMKRGRKKAGRWKLAIGVVAGVVLLAFGGLAFSFLNQNQSYTVFDSRFAVGSVTSRDGTTIGYRQIGHGPGVVLVHGGMASAQNFIQLAEALADDFTVYVYDRRGRGLSGPYGEDHSMRTEVEDLDAILTRTGARNVFGVSVGGLISLQAARTLPAIEKAAIYEPGLSVNGSTPTAWLERYDQKMAEGKVAAALVTGLKGAQMGPPLLTAMPDWLLELMTNAQMSQEEKKAPAGYVTWRSLAPALHYDTGLIVEMSERPDGKLETFKDMPAEVLLLGGSESAAFQKVSVDALESVLPQVRRVEFAGLDHGGSGNADMGGQPETVARELRQFFASPQTGASR